MQILLKQHNIEEALRDYVSKQGINLRGKEVSISFTNGRKNNGLIADINITEAEVQFPDLPDDDEEEVTSTKPKLVAVPSDAPAVQAEADEEAIQQEENAEATQVEEPSTKTTTSLFGS